MQAKVVLAGGSGQIGKMLQQHFSGSGYEVVVLSRSRSRGISRTVYWDGETIGPWADELEGAAVLINLAGRTVNCRYTSRNRAEIWASRARSTRVLGAAIRRLSSPPPLWLQSSTATIYADTLDTPNDEGAGVIGGLEPRAPETWRFSIDVARAWEGELALIETPATRKVCLRSAMTMDAAPGGIFDYLLWLVRTGLGGRAGSGRQYVSWIHAEDFCRVLDFLIADDSLAGPVNVCAPHPLPNDDFMGTLRRVWGRRFAIPLPKFLLEVGAVFLRTETELVLKSRRVVPGRLLDAGFEFRYPHWEAAARELCESWRKGK